MYAEASQALELCETPMMVNSALFGTERRFLRSPNLSTSAIHPRFMTTASPLLSLLFKSPLFSMHHPVDSP